MEDWVTWFQNVFNYIKNIFMHPVRTLQCHWLLENLYPRKKSPATCTSCTTVSKEDLLATHQLWDYMLMKQDLQKSDLIIVFGNQDLRTAEFSSKLWLDGWSTWIMFTGKDGALTKGKWSKSEAEVFQDVALSMGIPKERIILEMEATNTGENVLFSYEVLKSRDLIQQIRRVILVQMPLMERRTYATFMKQWPGFKENPELQVTVASPRIPLLEYPNEDVGPLDNLITLMMGCMYRIKTYPAIGFQTHQEIPDTVWGSYLNLYSTGKYNGHIPK